MKKSKEDAVIIIQRNWRMYSAKKLLQSLKEAKNLKFLNHKATVIQTAFKGYRTRKIMLLQQKSAVVIQSCVRKWLARTRFSKLKEVVMKIQSNYRAKVTGNIQRQRFLHIKRIVIRLQAHFRGVQLRKKVKAKDSAIIVLQSCVRMWLKRKHFLKLKHACISIQQKFRSLLLVRKQMKNFQNFRRSVIIIQKWYLDIRRKRLEQKSAIKIQTWVRKCVQRKKYLQLRSSIIAIQLWWKRVFITQKTRSLYLLNRKRVILLQAHVRRLIAQKMYKKKLMSIVIIQKGIRRTIAHKKFSVLKTKAVLIQRWWRNVLVGCRIKNEYLVCRRSAIKIQSHWRMYNALGTFHKLKKVASVIERYRIGKKERIAYLSLRKNTIKLQSLLRGYYCRKLFSNKKAAAIKIQRYFRSYMVRKSFLKQKLSAIKIQQHYRSYVCMRREHQKYIIMKAGFTRLQAVYRGVKVRKQMSCLHQKACIIQTFYRKWAARNHYLKQKISAIKIQQHFRSYVRMRQEHKKYIIMKVGFTRLQAVYRSVKVRKQMSCLHQKACIIQTFYRKWAARNRYLELRKACIVTQQRYRAQVQMKKQVLQYQILRKSVIQIQAAVRCRKERRNFLKQKRAVIKLQSFVRMLSVRRTYRQTREKVILIQRYHRSKCLRNRQLAIYAEARKRIIFLQSKVRCFIARQKYLKLKTACILVQSVIRMWLHRKKYSRLRQATLTIQRRFKSSKIAKNTRHEYVSMKTAAIRIQSFYRMVKQREAFRKTRTAAICIQRKYKAHLIAKEVRKTYLLQKRSCIKIQSSIRMIIARKKLLKMRCACITIQAIYRMNIIRQNYLQVKKSVCTLQKYYVAWKIGRECRQQLMHMKYSATVIQAALRGYAIRKELKLKKNACITIQAHTRRFLCQKHFLSQKNAAVVLQKHFKAIMIGRQIRRQYTSDRKCIINAQALVRGWLVRRRMQEFHHSAITIQKAYKAFICRKRFIKKKTSAVIIQKSFKSYQFRKKVHLFYLKLQHSATVIQSVWRGFKARCEFKRRIKAVVLLQSHVRKMLLRRKFLAMRQSVISIQLYYMAYKTGIKEYKLYHIKRRSCIKIQSAWRGFLVRRRMEKQRNAAVLIQKYFRSWTQKRKEKESLHLAFYQQHQWYAQLRSNMIVFQRQSRCFLQRRIKATLLIQSYFRMWRVRRCFKKFKAAVRIQASWRGYLVRKSITDPKVINSRHNIQKAPRNEQACLKNRTTRALQTLLTNKNLISILTCLQNLDVCTKLSPICCERLEQSAGLPILVQLVRSCNRSVPHKEIIKFSTNILLNLAKYKKTVNSVWADPNVLHMILDLMKIYREKGSDIFTKCCTLFYIFCQDPEKAEVLKQNRVFCNEIQSFHSLLIRKLSIEEKRARSSSNPSLATFLRRYHDRNSEESLDIDPDWLLGQHRRREFKDPYTAIKSLIHTLNLKVKS